MNSFNHYAFGSCGEWMYRVLGGIGVDPDRPGYQHILIHPRAASGGIWWSKTQYDSVRGRIICNWKIAGGRLSLDDVLRFNYFEYQGERIKTLGRLFNVSRVPASGFDPPKFGTPYDAMVDEAFGRLIDGMIAAEPAVNTATVIDLNGYITMHPTRVCKDWTGNREQDLAGNRCKKFYLGASLRGARVGLPQAARLADRVEREDFVRAGCDLAYSEEAARDFLVQTYARDTGEVVVLLTVPIFVKGQRYGAATATWKAE